MAIATYDDWLAKLQSPRQRIVSIESNSGLGNNRLSSLWIGTPLAGAAPTTAAVPARDLAGAIGQENGGGTALRVAGVSVNTAATGGGVLILCDRLSHQGGLVGNVNTEQTTNLPTAALTRYTSGVGVMACLEIYTIIGTTGTTVTSSYTDQDGNAAQVSPAVAIGATNFREAARAILLPCAVDDTGFRSVESVTLAATTGTAGNLGVTLFKPLLYIPMATGDAFDANPVFGTMGGGFPEILDDACLFWLWWQTSAGAPSGHGTNWAISFTED